MTPAWTLLTAFIGAGAILLLPEKHAGRARSVALVAAALGALAAGAACLDRLSDLSAAPWSFSQPWIPAFGIHFHLAADGISLALLLLTGIVAVAGILFSWNVTKRPRAFFSFYLTIIGGAYGVFLSQDAFLLFVFYEIVIIPKYFLIAVWGSSDREYGAMKLTLFSIAGSALVLVGLLVAFAASGGTGFALADLASFAYPLGLQQWAFPVLFLGFAVLAGLWPFHTWAPTGHAAAPTAASMLLAGVVMKLGAYGILRVAMPLFPEGMELWRPLIAGFAVAGIVFAAFTALTQRDLKFIIGYSSVSHMGFVLLGLATLTTWGLRGAVLQMISHGVIAGLLFGIAGRVIYDRTHTRQMSDLFRFRLRQNLPGAAFIFTAASAASMGMPGFSGFVAEISVLFGLWESYPWLLLPVAVGIIATGAFSLRALQEAFFRKAPAGSDPAGVLPPLTPAEIGGAALLLAATLAIGLYPFPWIVLIDDGLSSPLLAPLLSTP